MGRCLVSQDAQRVYAHLLALTIPYALRLPARHMIVSEFLIVTFDERRSRINATATGRLRTSFGTKVYNVIMV